ncbi:MAG TPA: hypothetical protein VHH36_03490 [Candidatus Thermoplasmatota archaeon]|nr:hypothetical protein [Candidatus Thermoplasmatota archaeon]
MRRAAWAIALLLVAPVGGALWSVEGNLEPDTEYDRGAGMFHEPDDDAAGRDGVYFNLVAVESYGATRTAGGGSIVNPNVAPGTRIAPHSLAFEAWLGVWRDCNRDGYVGMADGALWAYRAELADPEVCPDGTDFTREGWTFEFRWIHPSSHAANPANASAVQRGVYDRDVAVWADFGRPGDPQSLVCEVTPVPRGTLRSTGAMLAWLACQSGVSVAREVGENAPAGSGLAFEDPEHPERACGHALNRQTPWGDENCDGPSGAWEAGAPPAFTVWDCSARREDGEAMLDARDPTAPEDYSGRGQLNGTVYNPTAGTVPDDASPLAPGYNRTVGWFEDDQGSYAWFSAPAPRADRPTDGSYYEAARLARGNRECASRGYFPMHNGAGLLLPQYQDRDPLWYTQLDSPTFTERSLESRRTNLPEVDGKRSHDVIFGFSGAALHNQSMFQVGSPLFHNLDPHTGATFNNTPYMAGATAAFYHKGGGWSSHSAYRPPTYKMGLVRDNLDPSPGVWFTGFARVGLSTMRDFALPYGEGRYGHEECPELSDRVSAGGWDCDPGHWWNPDYGVVQGTSQTVAVGATYHLRDVDCYDGRLQPGGPRASPAAIAGDAPDACQE